MKTDTLIYFWSCIIIANINAAADNYLMAIVWICFAVGIFAYSIA
jgi:hypothetical protein